MAAWIVVGFTLALPAPAAAHHSGSGSDPGLEHLLRDAKISRAQAKARERWLELTPAARHRARRLDRRATTSTYVHGQAAAGDPRGVGSWAPPFVMATDYSGYAIHAAMLRTGKVLMWGYPLVPEEEEIRGTTSYAWLWDPAQGYGRGSFEDVTPTDASGNNIPIHCSGMSMLADGRVLAVGGTLAWEVGDPDNGREEPAGLNAAVIFDPVTETWTELPRPAGSQGRWYPTQVLLADGRTLVVSGLNEEPGRVVNDAHEIYDPETNTFTLLDTPEQRRTTQLYPHLFTMPDGTVLLAGPDRSDSAIFDPTDLAMPWTDLPRLQSDRVGGNAVLLPEGPAGSTRVAAIGGARYGHPPSALNEMIDLDDENPSWSSFPRLNTPRLNANTVLLPDRSMVTIGGNDEVDDSLLPERAVELYDRALRGWRVGPSQVETREYHSTALLLPDARVLSTGDDRHPTTSSTSEVPSPDETGEIYSPPYLFRGPRPVISYAPRAVRWDVPFAVGTTGDIDRAVLIAPAAVTHANDMNQRLVPLATVAEHRDGLTVQSPASASVAPPGWYMLFALNEGVPSVAEWVRLDSAAPDAVVVPPDRTPPRLRLRFRERQWLGRLRRTGKLRVGVSLDERAKVELRLLRRHRRVARVRKELGAGKHRVYLRPRRRTLRWLRRADHPRLRFSVVAIDAAENDTVWTRVLRPPLRN